MGTGSAFKRRDVVQTFLEGAAQISILLYSTLLYCTLPCGISFHYCLLYFSNLLFYCTFQLLSPTFTLLFYTALCDYTSAAPLFYYTLLSFFSTFLSSHFFCSALLCAILLYLCLLYTSPSPRDVEESRMPSSA